MDEYKLFGQSQIAQNNQQTTKKVEPSQQRSSLNGGASQSTGAQSIMSPNTSESPAQSSQQVYSNQGNSVINSVDVNNKKGRNKTCGKRTNALIRSSEMHGKSSIQANSLSQNKIPAAENNGNDLFGITKNRRHESGNHQEMPQVNNKFDVS